VGTNSAGWRFVAGSGFAVRLLIVASTCSRGTDWAGIQLPSTAAQMDCLGFDTAALTGIGALLDRLPVPDSHTAHVTLPVLGEIHLPKRLFVFLIWASLPWLVGAHDADSGKRYRTSEYVAPSAQNGTRNAAHVYRRGGLMDLILAVSNRRAVRVRYLGWCSAPDLPVVGWGLIAEFLCRFQTCHLRDWVGLWDHIAAPCARRWTPPDSDACSPTRWPPRRWCWTAS